MLMHRMEHPQSKQTICVLESSITEDACGSTTDGESFVIEHIFYATPKAIVVDHNADGRAFDLLLAIPGNHANDERLLHA